MVLNRFTKPSSRPASLCDQGLPHHLFHFASCNIASFFSSLVCKFYHLSASHSSMFTCVQLKSLESAVEDKKRELDSVLGEKENVEAQRDDLNNRLQAVLTLLGAAANGSQVTPSI